MMTRGIICILLLLVLAACLAISVRKPAEQTRVVYADDDDEQIVGDGAWPQAHYPASRANRSAAE